MNKSELKEKIKKLLGQPIVHQAAGFLEMAEGQFEKGAGGLFVPKPAGFAFHGYDEFKAMYLNKPVPPAFETDKDAWFVTEDMISNALMTDEQVMEIAKAMQKEYPYKGPAKLEYPKLEPVKEEEWDPDKGVIKLSEEDYHKLVDASLKHDIQPDKFILKKELGAIFISQSALDMLAKQMIEKTGMQEALLGTHPDTIIADDTPIKFEDGQQVPGAIAKDPAISPVGEPLYPGKLYFVDDPIKAKPVYTWSKGNIKPEGWKLLGVIAFELAHSLFTTDFDTESVHLECGIILTKDILEDYAFNDVLKTALVKHTAEQEKAKKLAKAIATTPPVDEDGLNSLQKKLADGLGLTPEEYKQFAIASIKPELPVAITQGAFNDLLKPGMANVYKEAYKEAADQFDKYGMPVVPASKTLKELAHELEIHQLEAKLKEFEKEMKIDEAQATAVALEKAKIAAQQLKNELEQKAVELAKKKAEDKQKKMIEYAQLYGAGPNVIDKILKPFKGEEPVTSTAERLDILEAIVASILLAPREMKIKDDSFTLSPKVLREVNDLFRVVVKRKKGDYHVTLE